jgi:hypothetical protein
VCDRQAPINEIDRVVIALPPNTMFYSDSVYVAVAFDAISGTETPRILGSSRCLAFLPRHQIFSALCEDRAIHKVGITDGALIRLIAQLDKIIVEIISHEPTVADMLVAFNKKRHGGEAMAFVHIGEEVL